MNKWLKYTLIGLGILIAIGIVGSALDNPDDSNAKPETKVVTKYKTKWKTKTETKEVKVVPSSCKHALKYAEAVQGFAGDFAGIVGDYPPLVAQAAEAGFDADPTALNKINDKMDSINSDLKDVNLKIEAAQENYQNAKQECLKAAGSKS